MTTSFPRFFEQRPATVLPLEQAWHAITAARTKAEELGIRACICVIDAKREVIVALRMDGSCWLSFEAARGKAEVAVTFGVPSADAEGLGALPGTDQVNRLHGNRLIFSAGALPITRGAEIIGAVGVSGHGDNDDPTDPQRGEIETATAAIEALDPWVASEQ
jgi:uncharacterized protein GlcG (DUF336 family)